MTSRKSKLLAGSLLTSLLLATAAQAQAQTQAQPSSPSATDVDELIVTGSRIRRNEYTSDAPLTVVTSESATLQGLVDTASMLQGQPAASGSFQVNSLMTGFVTDGGPGVETLSLRGLGPNRTLILLDGRRIGPAGVRGSVGPVDLNVVPASIIDRAEILKDGASSIYGSDAVAGVVNIITKKRLDGGELTAYASQPFDSGGEEYQIYGSWGKTFERGYVSISGDYTDQRVLRARDRDYLSCAEDRAYDPTTGERLDYIDPRTGSTKCYNFFNNGVIISGFGGLFQLAEPGITYPGPGQGNNIGTVFPGAAAAGFVRAGRGGQPATWPYLNYDTPWYGRTSAISPSKVATLYANGGYNLTPEIELYADLLINRRESEQFAFHQLGPFVAADYPGNVFGTEAIPLVAIRLDQAQTVDYIRAVGGARGTLPELPVIGGWDWDIFAQISKSDAEYKVDFVHWDRLIAASEFGGGCNPAAITISGPAPSCPTIPWFSARVLGGSFTAEEEAFLRGVAVGHTEYKQIALEGSLTGELWNLPAGPLSAAIGFHVRKDEINDQPDPEESAGNLYNWSSATPTVGEDSVREVFAELNAPVFRDWIGDFDVTLSGRYTDYDSYGSNSTYKVGFNWQVMPAFRIRGTKGTSYRAPALYELFIGDQTGFQTQNAIDPCINYQNSSNETLRANCAADGIPEEYGGGGLGATIITGGGAGILTAETSEAVTLGVIWTPNFETFDLSVGLDYFEIEVNDEVAQFGPASILAQCYISQNFANEPFCDLFTRDRSDPDAPRIDVVNDSYVNVANQVNRGLDLNLLARKEFSFGTFTLDVKATWQFEDTVQFLGESEPNDFNGSTTEPDFTANVQARYDRGDWTGFWNINMIGKASDSDLFTVNFTDVHPSNIYGLGRPVYYKQFTEFYATHDLSVRKKQDKWTFYAGVRNVFNEEPPAISGNNGFRVGYSALNAYDFRGRAGWIRIDRAF